MDHETPSDDSWSNTAKTSPGDTTTVAGATRRGREASDESDELYVRGGIAESESQVGRGKGRPPEAVRRDVESEFDDETKPGIDEEPEDGGRRTGGDEAGSHGRRSTWRDRREEANAGGLGPDEAEEDGEPETDGREPDEDEDEARHAADR